MMIVEEIKFSPIGCHMANIITSSSFLARLKGHNKEFIKELEERYSRDKTNIDAAAVLCFYQWFLSDDTLDLADTHSVFQVTSRVLHIIDEVLEVYPEYWIFWLLKYRIKSYTNYDEKEFIKELEHFIGQQYENKQESYYLVSELLLAYVLYSKDDTVYAGDILDGILIHYNNKIIILQQFFKGFLQEFQNLVKRSSEKDIADKLDRIYVKCF